MIAALLFTVSQTAVAVEPPTATIRPPSEQPLAIPIGENQAETSQKDPSTDKAHADAMRAYQKEFLSVRQGTSFSVAPGSSVGLGYGSGWGGWWNVGISTGPHVVRHAESIVFQGPLPVSMPTALDLIGDDAGAARVRRQIRGNKTLGYSLIGLGVAGLGTSIYSSLQAAQSRTLEEEGEWNMVGAAGIGATLIGFGTSSFPLRRARRLSSDPTALYAPDTLEDEFATYNDDLRQELGLSATEALELERD